MAFFGVLLVGAAAAVGQSRNGTNGDAYGLALRQQQLSQLQAQIRKTGCDQRRYANSVSECRRLNSQARAIQNEIASMQGQHRERRSGGLFGGLFSGRNWGRRDKAPDYSPYGQFRTRCVRLCDGYYFPLRYGVSPRNFGAENARCQASCDRPAKLFYQSTSDDDAANMVSLNGQRYGDLPNAFKYRSTYNPRCSCKPLPWSVEATREFHRREVVAELTGKQKRMANGVAAVAALLAGSDARMAARQGGGGMIQGPQSDWFGAQGGAFNDPRNAYIDPGFERPAPSVEQRRKLRRERRAKRRRDR